ncbi:complement C1q subcomponent subunit A-like [Narcine bancroftii]|uniref:complement C1q subcomponent subunit A-like n=1 Tax=Narcine bancroftii TaxID=1343680 RepID=UPI00383161D9
MKGVGLLLLILMAQAAANNKRCRGPDGQDGNPGNPGKPGRNGRVGEKGDTGDPGEASNVRGVVGEKGAPGDPGLPGVPGPRGYFGQIGPQGETGSPGLKGKKGQSGQRGGLVDNDRPAFSAVKVSSNHTSIGNIVSFDKHIVNKGDCFQTENGIFLTCKAGWYYFTYNLVTTGKLCINIMKNNQKQAGFCDVRAHINNDHQYQMNSGGIVVRLKMKDQVWLQTLPNFNNIFGSDEVNSVFSGFLLFPDE